jgi:aspartate aminotransferase
MQPIKSPAFFLGREEKGLISFGSGTPDLPPPKEVFKVLPHYHAFKYGLVQGQVNLRTDLSKEHPGSNFNDFVITNGASEALDLSIRYIAQQGGKKILIARPYFFAYPELIELAGMKPVFTDLVDGYIDLADFAQKLEECDGAIINSPGNPSGTVQSHKTMREIEKLSKDLDKWIISDEVYKDIIYVKDNYQLKGNKIIRVDSFSKTYDMTGYRIGYIYSKNKDVISNAVQMKSATSLNTSILSQQMAHAATKVHKKYVKDHIKIWKKRRDYMYEGLQKLGLETWKPDGAFYILAKMKNPYKVMMDLYYKHKVVVFNGEWFGAPDKIRFSYALDIPEIEEGLKRLKRYLRK